MPDIYDQHAKAFRGIDAYAVTLDGELVARIAIKRPKDGAGRLWAYIHYIGTPMRRAYAGGGGYNKAASAIRIASRDIVDTLADADDSASKAAVRFATILRDESRSWEQALTLAGYAVHQAV